MGKSPKAPDAAEMWWPPLLQAMHPYAHQVGQRTEWVNGKVQFLFVVQEQFPQVLEALHRDVLPAMDRFDSDPGSLHEALNEWHREWCLLDTWTCFASQETLASWVHDSPGPERPLRWSNLWWGVAGVGLTYGRPTFPALDPWFPRTDWSEYRSKALEQFEDALERYRVDIEAKADGDDREPISGRRLRLGDPMVWLVQHQVLKWSYKRIAKEQRETNEKRGRKAEKGRRHGPKAETVRHAVLKMAQEIGLTLRPAPGRTARPAVSGR